MKAQDVLDCPHGASPTDRRVRRVDIDGKTFWVKDFEVPSPPKWRALQSVLFLVTRAKVLRPVRSGAGAAGARAEIEAIGRFREIGAHVPEVVEARGSRILISHIGETLRHIELRGPRAALEEIAAEAAAEMGRIHMAGLVHGRPILRNLTWDGAKIGFIDFEEQPLSVMPLEAAQARDVLLFLVSLGRRNRQAAVSAAFQVYRDRMPSRVPAELHRVARLARPLAGRCGEILMRAANRDIVGVVRAIRALHRDGG